MYFKLYFNFDIKETDGLVNTAYYNMITIGKEMETQTSDLHFVENGQTNNVNDNTDFMVYPYPWKDDDALASNNAGVVENGTISPKDTAVEEVELHAVVVDVERAAYGAVESVTRQTEPNGAVSATETASSESKHATSDESISETGQLGYITNGGVELNGNNSHSHSGSDDGLELDAISLDLASSADKEMRKRLALSMGSTRC